jgi:site-specific DNA recombinase
MQDVEEGKVDCVVVYKVDRLSRSLLDFARLMQKFEQHHVSFVSVTQQFNTATSMGRLVLNVLLSFAQFEREIIAERTRDKIAATRRKGKWTGGNPFLGYDVDPRGSRLVVNPEESELVRAIFGLYLEHQGLLTVVRVLENRGWVNKRWQTKNGRERGGSPFTRTSLYRLLTNVAYAGKVRYKDEVHNGEQPAIVDPGVFQRVQALLKRNGGTGGAAVRTQFGAILQGLLRCGPCGCAMTPTQTTKNGTKRYRYYVCTAAQKCGWDKCPSKSVPAAQVERFVVEQIKGIGNDPALLHEVLEQARDQDAARTAGLEVEQRGLEKELAAWHGEIKKLSGQLRPGEDHDHLIARLADLQERVGLVEGRVKKVREQIHAVRHRLLDEEEAALALSVFDPVWGALTPQEQARVIGLLVERVEYDGAKGKVAITFHPTGINTLAEELADQRKERIA